MSGADTAWMDAENTCAAFLAELLDTKVGEGLRLGDVLSTDTANAFAFELGGEFIQSQNFQSHGDPPCQWITGARIIGQFIDRPAAQKAAGKIMTGINPRKNTGNTNNRGIPPNVNLFEMLDHPTVVSIIVTIDEVEMVLWVLEMNFRVQYSNKKN